MLGSAAPGRGAGGSDPVDEAAVAGYLHAEYELKHTEAANASASLAAARAYTAALARECPGVLAHAPSGDAPGPLLPSRHTSARERGEADRISRQLGSLRFELQFDVQVAAATPDRAALASFAAAVAKLHWSNPALAQRLAGYAGDASTLAVLSAGNSGELCADAHAWVGSGYRALAPSTKAPEALLLAALKEIGAGSERALGSLFAHNEGPAARAQLRRIEALAPSNAARSEAIEEQQSRAASVVGLPSEGSPTPMRSKPIGTLLASAGGFFRVVRARALPVFPGGCRTVVEIEYTSSEALPLGGSVTSTTTTLCLPHGSFTRSSPVTCQAGVVQIAERTAANVRRVRLLLSDGHTITSGVVPIPRRDGGPAGVYAQALAGAGPRPLALTELDARGRTVAVAKLPDGGRCAARGPIAPRLSDGSVTLARGVAPGGASFTIVAYRTPAILLRAPRGPARRSRVNLLLSAPALEGAGSELEAGGLLQRAQEPGAQPAHPAVLEPALQAGCPPHEAAVVYALLKARADTALARAGSTLTPLDKVPLPARLHEPAALVYGAFTAVPEEVIVRSAAGAQVATVDLRTRASEHREYCEGMAE
jgi:hypothetical protein